MQRVRTLIALAALFAWCSPAFARQIPSTFFGMSFNMTKTPWQVAPGTIRLWDTGTAWIWMNPSAGQYNWTTFDTWLSIAKQHHVDVIYTFGRTPQWASSNPTDSSCNYGPGQCDFPSNIKYWNDFVTAIVKHAQAWNQANGNSVKIYWETWNEPNAPTWNGTYAQMVQLEQELYNIAHSIDPNAVVLTPCPQGSHSYTWMDNFFAAGGAAYSDIIAFHGYLGSTSGLANPVENLIGVVNSMRNVMNKYGQNSKPLWDTEYAWDSGDDTAMPNLYDRAAFLVKSYVLHWSLGIERLVWYMYENRFNGTLYSSTTGLQPGGVAFNNISQWLKGAEMTSACTVNASATYSCAFLSASGQPMLVAWNSKTTVSLDGSQFTEYRDIYGGVHAIPAGGSVSVGHTPIFFFGAATTNPAPTAVLSVSPSSGVAPLTVSANGTGSHDAQGHAVARASVNFGDGTTVAGLTATHAYSAAGTFTVTLTVWDSNNISDTATSQVSVTSATDTPPVAVLHVTPLSGSIPLTVSASTVGSKDSDGTITSSLINFGDGTVVSGTSATHVYKSSGTFTVTATVRDNSGLSSSATAHVSTTSATFSHEPPVAVLAVTPQAGRAPLTVTASLAGSSDPSGGSITSSVDFGDGTIELGPTATHKYHKAGIYTVTAKVRNSFGLTGTATEQVYLSGAKADFKVDATPRAAADTTYTYELTVTAQDLLYSPISLFCSKAPAGASCSFSPQVVMPGQKPVSSMLTITLPQTAAVHGLGSLPWFALWLPIPGVALLGTGLDVKSARKRWTTVLLGCALLAMLAVATGCGGGSMSPSSSATALSADNTVTVMAKSATGTHTVTLYLTPRPSERHRR